MPAPQVHGQLPKCTTRSKRRGRESPPHRIRTLPHRHRLALALALLAALFWGLLPLALQIVFPVLDATPSPGADSSSPALLSGCFSPAATTSRTRCGSHRSCGRCCPIAIVGLTLNYTLFVVGVHLTSPATAQVVIQSANLFVLLGDMVVYRERFSGCSGSVPRC